MNEFFIVLFFSFDIFNAKFNWIWIVFALNNSTWSDSEAEWFYMHTNRKEPNWKRNPNRINKENSYSEICSMPNSIFFSILIWPSVRSNAKVNVRTAELLVDLLQFRHVVVSTHQRIGRFWYGHEYGDEMRTFFRADGLLIRNIAFRIANFSHHSGTTPLYLNRPIKHMCKQTCTDDDKDSSNQPIFLSF